MGFFGFNNKRKSTIGGDFDGDGVKNKKDCQPMNWKKQDTIRKEYRANKKGSTQGRYILADNKTEALRIAIESYGGSPSDWTVKFWKTIKY